MFFQFFSNISVREKASATDPANPVTTVFLNIFLTFGGSLHNRAFAHGNLSVTADAYFIAVLPRRWSSHEILHYPLNYLRMYGIEMNHLIRYFFKNQQNTDRKSCRRLDAGCTLISKRTETRRPKNFYASLWPHSGLEQIREYAFVFFLS